MTDDDKKTAAVVNALFEKIIRVKPAFRQGWPTETEFQLAKREWVSAFQRANISSLERVARGFEKLVDAPSSFIPSPGEFLALCKTNPEDIKAPPLDQAYNEACQKSHPCYGKEKNWSHEAVRYAASKSGSYFLRTEPVSKSKPVFEKHYEQACEDFASGRIMAQIETRVPTLAERQECGYYVKHDMEMPEELKWVLEYFTGEKRA